MFWVNFGATILGVVWIIEGIITHSFSAFHKINLMFTLLNAVCAVIWYKTKQFGF